MTLSDIFLCLVTMPLTMIELLHNYWPMGSGQVINFSPFLGNFIQSGGLMGHMGPGLELGLNNSFLFQELMCKLSAGSQTTFVFFASFSVVIIAWDRMSYVVTPSSPQFSTHGVSIGFSCVESSLDILQYKTISKFFWHSQTSKSLLLSDNKRKRFWLRQELK